MTRVRYAFAASLLGAGLVGGAALVAQDQKAPVPQLHSVLAGKKITPPIRGQADVEFTKPVTKRDKAMVVTSIQVKNVSKAPIARLKIDETWYDKGGAAVITSQGAINGLLQPDEIQTVKIQTPYNAKMASNNYNFGHANGTVKPHRVDKLEGASDAKDAKSAGKKEPAAKTAAAKKKK